MKKIKGNAYVVGNSIDTDVIIPARFLNTHSPKELAKDCMEDLDKNFHNKIKKGDIIVAGENFGCGSSREHAPISIKASGISAVVAKSFARIFFRNAINIGLPVFVCDLKDVTKNGDLIEIDPVKGEIKNLTKNKIFKIQPVPEFLQKIISAGGLLKSLKKRR